MAAVVGGYPQNIGRPIIRYMLTRSIGAKVLKNKERGRQNNIQSEIQTTDRKL